MAREGPSPEHPRPTAGEGFSRELLSPPTPPHSPPTPHPEMGPDPRGKPVQHQPSLLQRPAPEFPVDSMPRDPAPVSYAIRQQTLLNKIESGSSSHSPAIPVWTSVPRLPTLQPRNSQQPSIGSLQQLSLTSDDKSVSKQRVRFSEAEEDWLLNFVHTTFGRNKRKDWALVTEEHAKVYPRRKSQALAVKYSHLTGGHPDPFRHKMRKTASSTDPPPHPDDALVSAIPRYSNTAPPSDGNRKHYTTEQEEWLLDYIETRFDGPGKPRLWPAVAAAYEAKFAQKRKTSVLQQKFDELKHGRRERGRSSLSADTLSGSGSPMDITREPSPVEGAPGKRKRTDTSSDIFPGRTSKTKSRAFPNVEFTPRMARWLWDHIESCYTFNNENPDWNHINENFEKEFGGSPGEACLFVKYVEFVADSLPSDDDESDEEEEDEILPATKGNCSRLIRGSGPLKF